MRGARLVALYKDTERTAGFLLVQDSAFGCEGYNLYMDDEASNGSEPADNGSEPADNATPFERFENLTRRLVAVPKAEVDALRKKQEKARLRAAARRRS